MVKIQSAFYNWHFCSAVFSAVADFRLNIACRVGLIFTSCCLKDPTSVSKKTVPDPQTPSCVSMETPSVLKQPSLCLQGDKPWLQDSSFCLQGDSFCLQGDKLWSPGTQFLSPWRQALVPRDQNMAELTWQNQ